LSWLVRHEVSAARNAFCMMRTTLVCFKERQRACAARCGGAGGRKVAEVRYHAV